MRWELDWIENRSRLTPNAEALIDAEHGATWTYSELNERAMTTANWLVERGIRKGDRIALLSPNHISYFDLLFACGKIGAIFVPINWRLSPTEINYIISDCSPKLIGYHSKFQHLFSDGFLFNYTTFIVDSNDFSSQTGREFNGADVDEATPLAIIYTGGTTGAPKGVVLSHQSILYNAINTIISWNLTNEDRTLTYMPLFHTGGLNALSIPILLAGGKVIIASEFDPVRAIDYLNKFQCTIVLLVPTMYHMMIETEEFKNGSFKKIKTFLSGGAPCPLEIYDAFKEKDLLFKEGYGLTEAGPNNFYIASTLAFEKRGSVGKPMLFNTIKLIKADGTEAGTDEVGEIVIKGKHSFTYYWKNEQATMEVFKDGWLYTGDLAKKDADGYFYIVGRKKDMIITGGENVYPLEVEQWIASHPHIDEVAVIGIPDQKWGERIVAFIVTKKGEQPSQEQLKSYCSLKLAKFKIPKEFLYLDELPKTHVGKINKKALKEIVVNGQWG